MRSKKFPLTTPNVVYTKLACIVCHTILSHNHNPRYQQEQKIQIKHTQKYFLIFFAFLQDQWSNASPRATLRLATAPAPLWVLPPSLTLGHPIAGQNRILFFTIIHFSFQFIIDRKNGFDQNSHFSKIFTIVSLKFIPTIKIVWQPVLRQSSMFYTIPVFFLIWPSLLHALPDQNSFMIPPPLFYLCCWVIGAV